MSLLSRIQPAGRPRSRALSAAAMILFLVMTVAGSAQAAPSACPVAFVHLDPWQLSVRVRNTSGKEIAGLTFYAALADGAEQWKWFHPDLNDDRPLREFGWNRPIKPGAAKDLEWDDARMVSVPRGGGAFILTSVLYADGSSWESPPDRFDCKAFWYNDHRKSFVQPIRLPPRP